MAALPIWMTFMRAAIAGKDDEQFLGDEEAPALHLAAAKLPANSRSTFPRGGYPHRSIATPAPVATLHAKPVQAIAPVGRHVAPALPAPAAKPPVNPANRQRVKPALPTQPAPAGRATAAVKPASGY